VTKLLGGIEVGRSGRTDSVTGTSGSTDSVFVSLTSEESMVILTAGRDALFGAGCLIIL
jgi:hypothetical protein